jgi:antitoxin FitA
MGQILVRKVDDTLKRKLQRRARRHGRSMEEEVRNILRNAVKDEDSPEMGLGTRIAARFKGLVLGEQDFPASEIEARIPKFGR